VLARSVLAVLTLALASACVAGAGTEVSRANLLLDGKELRPELALTGDARARGLMSRRRAPRDGMLFVFPEGTTGGFWMKNTLVPLTIVFFDATGARVRRLTMKPCREDPCPIYDPRRQYRFALELPAGDERPARRLGPRAALRRLIARSS
jgi:uncharacterized protein